ncbi:transcriptional regulator [Putridiphycobacter roseus]|uniref:Transcriptional regulator n=1 Tax=Putridiphycobacter roseus TaxID=2219161 RepID=A0A2W1ND87_9FLAO|nr:Rrf2 family transcriptional regulator [Putridiphycobacter roseus]PZE16046.1 transcriptional regulator [Putridiphycobacter roseus]
MFSKSCEYALRAILFITQQSELGVKVNLTMISNEINSPIAFTAKILQQLTKNKIVKSNKGPKGGFEIEQQYLNTTYLSTIVQIFDGDKLYKGCGLGLSKCDAKNPCPMHFKFVAIRVQLKEMLEQHTISSLVQAMDADLLCLKR